MSGVVVNGQRHPLPQPPSLLALLAALGVAQNGVAVALNDQVVPRSAWLDTPLTDGDLLLVVTAIGGG